ncbi:MAG: primosomal protein N' [Proteobacteria bacterium]|nr:MAG: primosomal protein N' [Pseudomonadota bacterium]
MRQLAAASRGSRFRELAMIAPSVVKVAVPSPLHQTFDYLAADDVLVAPGVRVRVPFGRGRVIGVAVATAEGSDLPLGRLKRIDTVLDEAPLWSPEEWRLLLWAARYYQHPLGEVLSTALPALLRQGRAAQMEGERRWRLTLAGGKLSPADLARMPRQAALLARLQQCAGGCGNDELGAMGGAWRPALAAMRDKGWIEEVVMVPEAPPATPAIAHGPRLNAAQARAVDDVQAALGAFEPFLLEGVTGSGKTEVYLRLIEAVLERDAQALVLVPEIGLTPQLVERFRRRLTRPVVVLHSGLSDSDRLRAWLDARAGRAGVVIGTRSAVFTPLERLGLIVVDEEHDPSFKQQDGFRYHARDLAVLRARGADVPIVLGSATPALESLHNARQSRYRHLRLPERAGSAAHPCLDVLDLRRQPLEEGMARPLLQAVEATLAAGDQVLLFLNRRGYAPALLCHDCGWVAECRRCDAPLTLHRGRNRLCCHHCGAEQAIDTVCGDCASTDLSPAGRGTERIEEVLKARFPATPVIRIDRDTTRRRGALEKQLARVKRGEPCLLVGTQMLAKGHHFPSVTLVGMLNADYGLYSSDFRAAERMAQLIVQVAGRAGRAEKPGRVLIQTHHPDHALLQRLLREDYAAFASAALSERQAANFPPYAALALIRAEAPAVEPPRTFLESVARQVRQLGDETLQVWGPVPAPMERRAGRYRAQLLLQAVDRTPLQKILQHVVPQLAQLPGARKVRWSVDVDPVEMI